MQRFLQIGYAVFFVIGLLMLLVLPWPNGTAMYPFMVMIICAWGFWYSGKKHKRSTPSPSANMKNRTNPRNQTNTRNQKKSKKK